MAASTTRSMLIFLAGLASSFLVNLFVFYNACVFQQSHSSFSSFSTPLERKQEQSSGIRTATSSLEKELRHVEEQRDALLQQLDHYKRLENSRSSSSTAMKHAMDSAENKKNGGQTLFDSASPERSGNSNNNKHSSCSFLPHPVPTAASIWTDNLGKIFQASRHEIDPEYKYHDFTAMLLHYMSPARLQRSVKTLPNNFWNDQVKRISDILYTRYMHLKDKQEHEEQQGAKASSKEEENEPRKLNILVMGGSVTMGVMCRANPVMEQNFARRACAWPARLNDMLNQLLLGEQRKEKDLLINVKTITLGGTNTESGIHIWEYGLLPDDTPHPDILIHAYATNDMHVHSVADAASRNSTLQDNVRDMTQRFLRTVLSTSPSESCEEQKRPPPPLVIYLDDYLGNEQPEILSTMAVSQVMNLLGSYYGIMTVSYADAVRDLVYGDNHEHWFGPGGWFVPSQDEQNEETYKRQIHPGMGMHISVAWVIMYNLLNLASTYCSFNELSLDDGSENLDGRVTSSISAQVQAPPTTKDTDERWHAKYKAIHGLPTLRKTKSLSGRPAETPRGLPPPLTQDLMLRNVTNLWREQAPRSLSKQSTHNCNQNEDSRSISSEPSYKPCVFSWIGDMARGFDKPSALTRKIKPFLIRNKGWQADNDNNKLGYVAKGGLNSAFTLEFPNLSKPVVTVNFMVMQSYGEKWAGSRVQVDVFRLGNKFGSKEQWTDPLCGMEMAGYHGKNTSETLNYKMHLLACVETAGSEKHHGAEIGDSLRVSIRLVGGSTFKIMGMAFCDH